MLTTFAMLFSLAVVASLLPPVSSVRLVSFVGDVAHSGWWRWSVWLADVDSWPAVCRSASDDRNPRSSTTPALPLPAWRRNEGARLPGAKLYGLEVG